MRKFLLSALAAVFLMAAAAPAFAVSVKSASDKGISEIQFGGTMLTRGWYLDETYINERPSRRKDNRSQSYFNSNFLLSTAFVASEDLKGVWVIEVDDVIWGKNDGGLRTNRNNNMVEVDALSDDIDAGDSGNVETNQLYVEFKVPHLPLNLTVGLQNFSLGHGIIMSGVGSTGAGTPAAGITLNIDIDPLDVNLFTFKRMENNFRDADDTDYYGLTTNISLGDMGSIGIFGMWGRTDGDAASNTTFERDFDSYGKTDGSDGFIANSDGYFDRYDAWWYGITADMAMDPIEIAFEADFYQALWSADKKGDRDYRGSGWFTWLDIGANLGDMGKAGFAGFIASGNPNDSYMNNDGSNGYTNNNFAQIAAWDRNDGAVLNWDNLFVRDGVAFNNSEATVNPYSNNDNKLQNMYSAKAYCSVNPTDWLAAGFNTNLYWKYNDFRGDEDGERGFYGVELDLDIALKIYDQLTWSLEGGYMFTSDSALDPTPRGNTNAEEKAIGTDNQENDNMVTSDIWAITSTLVYSF